MQPLPPEAVAGMDQRAAQCGLALDDLVAKFKMVAGLHGSAGAAGAIAGELYMSCPVNQIIDLLAFAIGRLAEQQGEADA